MLGGALVFSQGSLLEQRTQLLESGQLEKETLVDSLNAWSKVYARKNIDTAFYFVVKARDVATQLNYQMGLGESYNRIGVLHKNKGQFKEAEANYLKGLEIRTNLKDTTGMVGVLNNLGSLWKRQRDYEKAKSYYQKSLELLDTHLNLKLEAKVYKNLGSIYRDEGKFLEAIQSYEKASPIYIEAKDTNGLAQNILNQAVLYFRTMKINKSLQLLEESYQLFRSVGNLGGQALCHINVGNCYQRLEKWEEAGQAYQKAIDLGDHLSKVGLLDVKRNYGILEIERGNTSAGLMKLEECLAGFQALNLQRQVLELNYSIGQVYFDSAYQDYPKAINYLEKSLEAVNDSTDPRTRLSILFLLSNAYYNSGDLKKGFSYIEDYNKLNNKILTEYYSYSDFKDSLEEEKFKSAQLATALELEQTKNSRKNLFITALGGLLFLGILLGVALYNSASNKKKKVEAEKQKIEVEQQIDDLLQTQERKTTFAHLQGQELERERIARNLHDDLGASLATIKTFLGALDIDLDQNKKENIKGFGNLKKASDLLDNACEYVRNVSHEMHSPVLSKFGLGPQVKDLVETLNESGQIVARAILHKFNNLRLKSLQEVQLYRVIQELVSNTLKHAEAKKLTIQLNYFEDEQLVNIQVEDDGKGFDVEKAKQKKGMGLDNINTRVKELGGTIDFDSKPNNGGTLVNIDFPLDKPEVSEVPELELVKH